MKFKSKILVLCGLWLLSFGVNIFASSANDHFTNEASISHVYVDLAGSDTFTGNMISAKHYFSPVFTNDVPLAEADYFSRASNIALSMFKGEQKSNSFSYKNQNSLVKVVYFFPGNPFTVSGQYRISRFNSDDFDSGKTKEWMLGAGYYMTNETKIFASYSRQVQPGSGLRGDNRRAEYGIGAKWARLFNMDRTIVIEANYMDYRDEDDISTHSKGKIIRLDGDYYFTQALSLGLQYQYQKDHLTGSGSDFTVHNYALAGKYFMSSSTFIEGRVQQQDFEGVGRRSSIESWFVEVGYRF